MAGKWSGFRLVALDGGSRRTRRGSRPGSASDVCPGTAGRTAFSTLRYGSEDWRLLADMVEVEAHVARHAIVPSLDSRGSDRRNDRSNRPCFAVECEKIHFKAC